MGEWLKTGEYVKERKKFLKAEVEEIKKKYRKKPELVTIIVGENPESLKYVKSKISLAEELGIGGRVLRFKESISENELISIVKELSDDNKISGILVQLPLPEHVNSGTIVEKILPEKDVDGFSPLNLGKLLRGEETLYPCTPLGIVKFLKWKGFTLKGKRAIVLGRSNIVGKPLLHLLLKENAPVTIAHSKTEDRKSLTREADFIFVAIGKPFFLKSSMVKEGAIVIDVGINYITSESFVLRELSGFPEKVEKFKKKGYLVGGDVHPEVKNVASYLTPVPGGVGKLTVLTLMENTVKAFYMLNKHNKEA